MASIDDMHLINLDITTEGSLAIATLDDLNLRSTKPSMIISSRSDTKGFEMRVYFSMPRTNCHLAIFE